MNIYIYMHRKKTGRKKIANRLHPQLPDCFIPTGP